MYSPARVLDTGISCTKKLSSPTVESRIDSMAAFAASCFFVGGSSFANVCEWKISSFSVTDGTSCSVGMNFPRLSENTFRTSVGNESVLSPRADVLEVPTFREWFGEGADEWLALTQPQEKRYKGSSRRLHTIAPNGLPDMRRLLHSSRSEGRGDSREERHPLGDNLDNFQYRPCILRIPVLDNNTYEAVEHVLLDPV